MWYSVLLTLSRRFRICLDAVLAPAVKWANRKNSGGETIGGTYAFYDLNVSRIHDIAATADFSWLPDESHHVRFGASYQFHIYSPSRQGLMTVNEIGPAGKSDTEAVSPDGAG